MKFTEEQAVAMAKECGAYEFFEISPDNPGDVKHLTAFANLVAERAVGEERESCAKEAERGEWRLSKTAKAIAAAIRRRANTSIEAERGKV